jgi:hypothetical protein
MPGLLLLVAAIQLVRVPYTRAQGCFTSGSTGTNGDFNPPSSWPVNVGWSTNGNVITVTNSANGVFNFGKIYIETNWVVQFVRNALNTPVFLLATNNVTINGSIDVSGGNGGTSPPGNGGVGGPGGFDGGLGASSTYYGFGSGPGGGGLDGWGGGFGTQATGPGGGVAYGTIDVQPFIGGSGGSGWNGGAGGGGGALLIASSGTINISGTLTANGGSEVGSSGDGSGGAIRLIASTIQGEGLIEAVGAPGSTAGGNGRIRLEACIYNRVSLTDPPATFSQPAAVFLATNPTIVVTSIAGVNTPSVPTGSFAVADTYLPSNFTNPAAVSVSANNISNGTTFSVIVTPVWGTNMVGTGTLYGTYTSSTGTVSMLVYTDRIWRVNALIPYIPRP